MRKLKSGLVQISEIKITVAICKCVLESLLLFNFHFNKLLSFSDQFFTTFIWQFFFSKVLICTDIINSPAALFDMLLQTSNLWVFSILKYVRILEKLEKLVWNEIYDQPTSNQFRLQLSEQVLTDDLTQ